VANNSVATGRRLREVLAESHIAAVAIAMLLFWSVSLVLWGLEAPLYRIGGFLVTAVAIHDVPYDSFTGADRVMLLTMGLYFFYALTYFIAAWALSRWVCDMGPLAGLKKTRTRLQRRDGA
jgi:hypothetical protein